MGWINVFTYKASHQVQDIDLLSASKKAIEHKNINNKSQLKSSVRLGKLMNEVTSKWNELADQKMDGWMDDITIEIKKKHSWRQQIDNEFFILFTLSLDNTEG